MSFVLARHDKDPGGFKKKKIMWFGIIVEFYCKVSGTWSARGEGRAEAFTHRHFIPNKKEEISQLDCIIGPMRRNDEIFIHNILCLREYKKRHTYEFSKNRTKCGRGWKSTTEDQSVKFHKEVMIINGSAAEDLAPMQKTTENAARKVV